jgi:menaquinone-dependent protoporphyrinogen IX oxidase
MRVCILYKDVGSSQVCKELSESLAKGVQQQGHFVDLINIATNLGKNIAFYDYIILGTSATTLLGGKIDPQVGLFLKQCGTISGKRSFAFISKRGLRKGKTLLRLMSVMEQEGMYLTFSEILTGSAFAEEIGKRLLIT